MSIINSILRKTESKNVLNILCAPAHERTESKLAECNGIQFWAYRSKQVKDWNTKYAKIPSNYVLLNPEKGENQVPAWVDFDLGLSHNRFGQYQCLAPICNKLGIPLITYEHTWPIPEWQNNGVLNELKKMRGVLNVFISEASKKAWGWEDDKSAIVIPHGVDTELFKPLNVDKKQYILTTVNEYSRDVRRWCIGFDIYEQVTKDLPKLNVGDDPPYSKPANSVEELVKYHNEAYVFLNTSTHSPFPTSLFESMAAGQICVSTATCMIPEVIQHGYNGLLTNDLNEMRGYLIDILNHREKYEFLGQNARKTILERFTLQRFVDDWNKVLEQFK